MKLAMKIAAAVFAGTALGLFATWLTVVRTAMPEGISNGLWTTNLADGSPHGGPYIRAKIAVHGFLALNRSETVYYTATHDSDGYRFDGRCVYAVSRGDLDARWWSMTAYGRDEFLIPNPADRYIDDDRNIPALEAVLQQDHCETIAPNNERQRAS